MEHQPKYFEEALSNMVHDVASGGAIRHLVDMGYSVNQIMEHLDYPTPRSRVEETVFCYMTESGMLIEALPIPEEQFRKVNLRAESRKNLSRAIRERIKKNGEENAYLLCSCGKWCRMLKDMGKQAVSGLDLQTEPDIFQNLTSRERDYLLGIPWKGEVMYHQITDRMLEIAIELALSGESIRFYFLQDKEVLCIARENFDVF